MCNVESTISWEKTLGNVKERLYSIVLLRDERGSPAARMPLVKANELDPHSEQMLARIPVDDTLLPNGNDSHQPTPLPQPPPQGMSQIYDPDRKIGSQWTNDEQFTPRFNKRAAVSGSSKRGIQAKIHHNSPSLSQDRKRTQITPRLFIGSSFLLPSLFIIQLSDPIFFDWSCALPCKTTSSLISPKENLFGLFPGNH